MATKKYIAINIDGQNADFPPDSANFPLTYSVEEERGISLVQGSRTQRSITIPATKSNDNIFDSWWDVARNNLEAANFKPVEVTVDGLPVMQGQAQLTEVTTKAAKNSWNGKEYRVALYGNNADWFLQLKDKQISDLDFSDCIHTFDPANVQNGFLAEYDSGDIYGYAVIKLRDWSNFNSVAWSDCTPFLFIKAILDRAFNSIGYTYSSAFFDTDIFKRLILPLPFPQKYPEQYGQDFLNIVAETSTTIITPPFLTPIIFDTQTTTPTFANPYNQATGEYTVPTQGFYKINVNITVDNLPVVAYSYTVHVRLNGIIVGFLIFIPTTEPLTNGQTIGGVVTIQANAGDIITITNLATTSFDITLASLDIEGEAILTAGVQVRCEYLLRQYKITDLIKGLAEMFNLNFETKGLGNNVVVEPKDSYLYRQRTPVPINQFNQGFLIDNADNLTGKVDLQKEGKVKAISDIDENFVFQYQTTDPTVEGSEALQDNKLYESRYVFNQDRFLKQTNSRENSFFSSTIHLFDREIQGAGSDFTPLVPLIFPVDYNQNTTASESNVTEIGARILYFAGQRGGIDGTINFDNSTTISQIDLPASFMVNYNDITGQDPSLSYADITINNTVTPGLLRQFFIREFARRRAGKQVEIYMNLNEIDILNLTFRDKIWINSQLYVLKKVESWSPIIDKSTKVILQFDKLDEQQDYDNIQNSTIPGALGQPFIEG